MIKAVRSYENSETNHPLMPGRVFPFHTCIRQWEAELCFRTNGET